MIMDTAADSSGSTGLSSIKAMSDNAQRTGRFDPGPQKFITVPPIIKPIQHNSRVPGKSKASGRKLPGRIPTGRSPHIKVTRARRLSSSKSPTKKSIDISNIMGTKVFMEPPMAKSGTNLSSNSRSTKLTTTTETTAATSFTRASADTKKTLTIAIKGTERTKTSESMPLLIAPAPTRSCGSHLTLGLSKNTRVMSRSAGLPSQGGGRTQTGIRIPYFTRATLSSSTRETLGLMKLKHARQLLTTRSENSGIWKPRVIKGGLHPRTPIKVSAIPVGATEQESNTEKRKGKGEKSRPSTAETGQPQQTESKTGQRKSKHKKSKLSSATREQPENKTDGRTSKSKKARPSAVKTEKPQKPESKMDKKENKGKKSTPSTAATEQPIQPESRTDKSKSKGKKSTPSTAATEQPIQPESRTDKRKSKGKKSTPSTVATGTQRSRAASRKSKKSISTTGKKAKKSKAKPSTDAADTKTRRATKKSNAESGKGKKGKRAPSMPSTPPTTDIESSRASSKKSKKSKQSKGSKRGKGKKAKKGKAKVKKLNRKVIYKDMKIAEKKMEEEAKNRKKMEWEKNKLYFYFNCVIARLLDLQKRNHGLKKKEASLKMEKKDGMFHQNWKTMNLARLQREECLEAKRAEFRSMIRELRDSHKCQTDWLFKDIQTYVKDTYLVGQKYVNDVVGIRMDYTKGLTDTMFEARENLRVMEIEQNAKYGPALEEFEEQMRKLRSRIPTERQERLSEMLVKSHGMLVELVNVYTTILHHNYIEVCHTANIINELKSVERRLEREMTDMVKKREKIKERTEYLHDRVSNLRRQVNAGKEARKKLHRVLKEQDVLQSKIDLAYICKEITYQENSRLKTALQEMSERVDKWYFKVKRDFIKDIVLDAAKHEERASQLKNYNHLVKYLFNEEHDFLETISNFKEHEEFDDPKEGLKVLLGVYRPHTLYDLEREFEGCTESFTTAIIFFKRRLQQNYMSLDDLHFFIRRRCPLSYLNKVRKEEMQLKQLMSFIFGSRYGHVKQCGHQGLTIASSHSFKL